MSEKLRECPFCGELPKLNMMNIYGKNGSSVKYSYTCSNCGLLMIEWDKEKLIKLWNTRHEPETIEHQFYAVCDDHGKDGPARIKCLSCETMGINGNSNYCPNCGGKFSK